MKNSFSFSIAAVAMCTFLACNGTDRKQGDQSRSTIDSIQDSSTHTKMPGDTTANGQQQTFVNAAAIGGMMEVEAANVAITLSQNPAVKEFAMQMLKDHGKANQELSTLAPQLGLQVPRSLPDMEKMHISDLKTLGDKKFDEQYITMMLADHAKTMKLFGEGTTFADSSLQNFAKRTLPIIKSHYVKAVKIGKSLNLSHAGNGDDPQGMSPAPGTKQL